MAVEEPQPRFSTSLLVVVMQLTQEGKGNVEVQPYDLDVLEEIWPSPRMEQARQVGIGYNLLSIK
jgi:hypothetical protein